MLIQIRMSPTAVNITTSNVSNAVIGSITVDSVGTALADSGTDTQYIAAQTASYSESNVTTDRTYDANSTSVDELADVLGTLIADLRARGIIPE